MNSEPHYGITPNEMLTTLKVLEHIVKHAQDRTVILNDCQHMTTILQGAINNGIIPERIA